MELTATVNTMGKKIHRIVAKTLEDGRVKDSPIIRFNVNGVDGFVAIYPNLGPDGKGEVNLYIVGGSNDTIYVDGKKLSTTYNPVKK